MFHRSNRYHRLTFGLILCAIWLLGMDTQATAGTVTWINVKYDMAAGWSGPEFLGYTELDGSDSYDGLAHNGVNAVIGLTGMVSAAWNLNLYSFSSSGPGTNMGAFFSNMGLHYNPPDNSSRHFFFRLNAEIVFSIDRAGSFSAGHALVEDLGPFQALKLEAGTLIGSLFIPTSTIVDPFSLASVVDLPPGTYRFTQNADTVLDRDQAFQLGNNVIWQVKEAQSQPPLATDDFFGLTQGSVLNELAPGILVNDSDPDEDDLTVALVDAPTHAVSFSLNPDGSFTYFPLPYFYGTDTFTYIANDGASDSNVATVTITVAQPGAQGFITGGGKFFQDGAKCTFGFNAKSQGGPKGNLEFQNHEAGIDVKSTSVDWVYVANATDGFFSGTCKVNGDSGYAFFVQVHDRGEPGRDDDFSIWVLNSFGLPVHSWTGQLSGGNIQIHGS